MDKKVIKVDFKKENKIKELDEKIEKLKDELAYNIDIGNINEISKKEKELAMAMFEKSMEEN